MSETIKEYEAELEELEREDYILSELLLIRGYVTDLHRERLRVRERIEALCLSIEHLHQEGGEGSQD